LSTQKSQWNPSQEVEWLAFVINLSKGEFTIPSNKIDGLRVKLFELNSVDLVATKQIVSVIGTMSLALGAVTHLMT